VQQVGYLQESEDILLYYY